MILRVAVGEPLEAGAHFPSARKTRRYLHIISRLLRKCRKKKKKVFRWLLQIGFLIPVFALGFRRNVARLNEAKHVS